MKSYVFAVLFIAVMAFSGCTSNVKGVTFGYNYVGYENEKTAVSVRKLDDVDTGTLHLRANARAKNNALPAFEATVSRVSDQETQLDVYVKAK